jgi:hypothetical protein
VSDEDYLKLQRLYAVQAHAIDCGDAERWAATFTADGRFQSPSAGGTVAGRAELERFAADYAPEGRDGRRYRHWINQLDASYDEDGNITAVCYGALLAIEPGGAPAVLRTSIHHDHLKPTASGWRIGSRVIEPDSRPLDYSAGGAEPTAADVETG